MNRNPVENYLNILIGYLHDPLGIACASGLVVLIVWMCYRGLWDWVDDGLSGTKEIIKAPKGAFILFLFASKYLHELRYGSDKSGNSEDDLR
ncbi:hypothetical protein [Escherichia coli]|jgi:hypothetical protein|uniref:hypothetical protein n=1 Tax=Escherichia coli TaxID=562 RepID=UPI0007A61D10|nr:hypothetical protein [Escherichia coli]